MEVIINAYSGHSPKNRFLEEWVYNYLAQKDLGNKISEELILPSFPSLNSGSILEIKYGISHGKVGAVLVSVLNDENVKWLSFHMTFKNNKANQISNVILTKGY